MSEGGAGPRAGNASVTTTADAPVNAMTVDVEEYFQVSAFAGHIAPEAWPRIPSRLEACTERLLELLGERDITATFFTLGWVAERFPALVRRLAENGHEVASHGYDHVRATIQTPAEFREDVTKTRHLLEDAAGQAVLGYRAPSFSLDASNPWVWDVLAETGHRYSSSLYPIRHDHYGLPDAPRQPFDTPSGLREIPISTLRLLGANLPCGGGGYFRLLPYTYSAWAIRRINEAEGASAVFYLHPWELDPDQPRQPGLGLKTRVRHYTNLRRMGARLARLLDAFRWDRMDRIFLAPAPEAPSSACPTVPARTAVGP